MTVQDNVGSTYVPHPLPFQGTDLTNTNGTLNGIQATSKEYRMPYGGSIIGFSGTLNAALTTGTLSFQPTINGSLSPAFSNAELHTNQQEAHQVFNQSGKFQYTFAAGDALGVRYFSSDTVNPETTDGNFLLMIVLDEVRY